MTQPSVFTLPSTFVGSISEGTMRAEDLVPRFVNVLASADSQHDLVLEWTSIWDGIVAVATFLDVDPEYIAEVVDLWRSEKMGYFLNEELFDALNMVAPTNTYFGSSEGDGASYGFWYMDCDVCGESMSDGHDCDAELAEKEGYEQAAVDDRNSPDVEDGVR